MILENVTQEFLQIVCFITLPPPPQSLFLGPVLFFSCLSLSLSSLRMALWGWIHQVCKLPPSSDTSLAESAGSPAGIVRVKLKNNKTCQWRFPSHGAWHQSVLKKAAVALIFPFLQLAWISQSTWGSPPFSHSGREDRNRCREVTSFTSILFWKN